MSYFVLGMKDIQKLANHPVHIKDKEGNLLPTALIPFCEFNGNISVMGLKIDQFDDPVCNSFEAKIVGDQMCYTIDPNKYKNFHDDNDIFSISLYLSFNEDRMFSTSKLDDGLLDQQKLILIETISKYPKSCNHSKSLI